MIGDLAIADAVLSERDAVTDVRAMRSTFQVWTSDRGRTASAAAP